MAEHWLCMFQVPGSLPGAVRKSAAWIPEVNVEELSSLGSVSIAQEIQHSRDPHRNGAKPTSQQSRHCWISAVPFWFHSFSLLVWLHPFLPVYIIQGLLRLGSGKREKCKTGSGLRRLQRAIMRLEEACRMGLLGLERPPMTLVSTRASDWSLFGAKHEQGRTEEPKSWPIVDSWSN